MAVYGRSKPYMDAGKYCNRCGIERRKNGGLTGSYCADCAPAARQLGWTE